MKIEVYFLGQPEIRVDQTRLQIAQRKIEAMLLYLLFNGSCTREELAAIFWCDCDEESARRNLRNSLYKIRNLLGRDFLVTNGKFHISLNPKLEVHRDTDLFVVENSEQKLIELNSFCFLDKFYLKNCPEFEEWVRCMQNTYERLLEERLLPAMRTSFKKGDHGLAERYAEAIRRFNVYSEEAVYILMKRCEQSGDYNKAVLLYTQFAERLYQDMRLEPGVQTKKEYENVLRMKAEMRKNSVKGPFYLGHIKALSALSEEYLKYRQGHPYDNCILCGEEGMDKEEVWWKFAREYKSEPVVRIQLRPLNREVEYYAIRKCLLGAAGLFGISQEEILNRKDMESADLFFMNAIDRLARRITGMKKRCILMIYGLEFADKKSISLILGYFLERVKREIFVAASLCLNCREELPVPVEDKYDSGIRPLFLEALCEGECSRYLKECLPEEKPLLLEERELYQYTAGNLTLLREVASNLSGTGENAFFMNSKAENQFMCLFRCFSSQEYRYLEYLTIMENGVEVETLSRLIQETPIQVLNAFEGLQKRGLLAEVNQTGHGRLKLKSKMLRDMIYGKLPEFKKQEFHKLAKSYYKQSSPNETYDLFVLSELKYHSTQAGCLTEGLYYSIYYLKYILDYYDEFFPAVPHDVEYLRKCSISRKEVNQTLDSFQSCLDMLESEMETELLYKLQMEIYFLRGRSLNRDGKREKGLVYAEKLIALAKEAGDEKMLLNGYIEALCYGVKAEDPVLMKDYLKRVNQLEILPSHEAEYGAILRLEGYCCILEEEYGRAEQNLKQSIEIFERPKYRNTCCYKAAGAYDYLAITYRKRGQYEKAQQAMEEALRLCLARNSLKGLDLFYEDYAYIFFIQGNYVEAEKYFRLSAQIYDEYGTYWLRSVGESCMAMIHLERGEEKEALEHFRRAEIFSRKEKTKEELKILEEARVRLRKAGHKR